LAPAGVKPGGPAADIQAGAPRGHRIPRHATPPPTVKHPHLLPPPAATAAPAPAPDWDHSTLRLNKADVTLFQALGETAQRRPCLILYSGEHSGMRYPLQGSKLLLGRSADCDVCLESPGISRHHAVLREQGKDVVLHDMGSSNGTHLNEQRIDAPTALKDGDTLRLGGAVLKFYQGQSLDALLHDRIYRLATVDTGTEVHTKKYLLEALEREIKIARRNGRPLSVLCIDLDHFKRVNDRYGHNAGDLVLRGAAAAASETVRSSDIVGRTGGEEFAIILPDTELADALALAERIRVAVAARRFDLQVLGSARKVQHRQTASLGAAQLGGNMLGARDLLGAADVHLYAAKQGGRNGVSG
jgi:two-component system cell cycle response regulator